MPGRFHTGRRFEYRSSSFRRPTFTLVKPPATGVVTGPFSATLFLRIESINSTGSVCPVRSKARRSEEHTSELQSLTNLVCRLLLEKKKKRYNSICSEAI